jgi:hypothetical protein
MQCFMFLLLNNDYSFNKLNCLDKNNFEVRFSFICKCLDTVLKPYIEEEQATQWPKEKVQKAKQRH